MPLTFYVDQPDFIEKLNDLYDQVQALGSITLLRGPAGVPGPRGFTGSRGLSGTLGVAGSQIYSGTGAPLIGLGIDGDYYIDTLGKALYGPKTGGAWPLPPLSLGSDVVQREAIIALANGNASNDLDWDLYGAFTLTCTGTSCALNHMNLPGADGKLGSMLGFIDNGGNADVTVLFPGVIWTANTAPDMPTLGFNMVSLWCFDQVTIYGVAA
jgi:hypothetical protein